MAERCQFKECGNFADVNEAPNTHPLFSSAREFGPATMVGMPERQNLRRKLDLLAQLPGIELKNAYKVNWVTCYGTKYKKGGIIICNVDGNRMLPVFGEITVVWVIGDFLYFEYMPLDTL